MADTLSSIADELYALTPDAFTAARNDRAKQEKDAGDKDLANRVRALTKPSAAAWVVNMLARHRTDDIDQVIALGASFREAQEDLDRDELRELTKQRQKLIAALAKQGHKLAEELGSPVGVSATNDIEQTLQAAMADEHAAVAVRSGRLTRALSSTGLGEVDLTDAVAGTLEGVKLPTPSKERAPIDLAAERELRDARKRAGEAERANKEAQRQLAAAERKLENLAPKRDQLAEQLQELRDRIADVESRLEEIDEEIESVESDRKSASRAVAESESDAADANERLEQLQR
jgi:chromosome segregation ATPase